MNGTGPGLGPGAGRVRLLVVLSLIVALVHAPAAAASGVETDPALLTGLDGVVALSPPDTCLRVDLGRATVFRHQADRPLVPASTQKLMVAHAAIEKLGADHRYRTRVLATAPVEGVVQGDLVLVGGGDPLLTTAAYAFTRRTADQPLTFLDALADQVAASGVRRVTGRVLGDESRYDSLRAVPTWPPRYLTQEQIGPLSALLVDDGYRLEFPADGGEPERRRVDDPPGLAAELFVGLLAARGIVVDGGHATGAAPAGAPELTAVDSQPLGETVRQMLEESDNATAELITKELGLDSGGGGSTAAGTASITSTLTGLGLPTSASLMVDGSGLDPTNRSTCDLLVEVLTTSGGPDGAIGSRLPVAGRSGTLRERFLGSPAQGRLKAKTGSLNQVTALAGFVAMPDGQMATFAYIANGPQAEDPRRGQDFLGALLGQYEVTCSDDPVAPVIAPVGAYALTAAAVGAGPSVAAMAPSLAVALQAYEDHPATFVSPCLVGAPDFSLRFPA